MSNIKIKRIASELSREISNILANEARDTIMHTITITGCDVTNDLSFAKVYFTSLSELSPKQLERELEEASGYIRTLLADRVDLRHTPKLQFVYDKSIEYGNKIEQIIKEIHEEDK